MTGTGKKHPLGVDWFMPYLQVLKELRTSIDSERLAMLKRLESFRNLSNAMMAYQNDAGPAPTVRQFEEWRDQVTEAIQSRSASLRDLASLP